MNHPSDRQPLALGVSRGQQFTDAPRPSSGGPAIAGSVMLHITCVLAVLTISHTATQHAASAPRRHTSLTFAPVTLAAPIEAVRPRIEPAPLAIRRPDPAKPHSSMPPEDAPRIERPTTTPIAEAVRTETAEPPANMAAPATPLIAEPAVRVGAFESAPAHRPTTRDTGTVAAAGFGDASARGTGRIVPTAIVAAGGFDRQTAPPPPVAAAAATDAAFGDSSIEILFKPKPRYTDEAEALGIQGTVVLEVEFTASNDVRVLRVVRTLGHGLDEAAMRAAEQIRFKPARRQGVPVDARVTVQIEFRLS